MAKILHLTEPGTYTSPSGTEFPMTVEHSGKLTALYEYNKDGTKCYSPILGKPCVGGTTIFEGMSKIHIAHTGPKTCEVESFWKTSKK